MLELIGLILAACDFFGWTSKLEGWLTRLRERLWTLLSSLRPIDLRPGKTVDPGELRGWDQRTERLITAGVLVTILGTALAFLYWSETRVPHPPYPTETVGDILLLITGAVLGFALACVVAAVVLFLAFNFLIWVVMAPLAFVLHVLSIPRRGIVASIGLLLAVVGVFEKYHR